MKLVTGKNGRQVYIAGPGETMDHAVNGIPVFVEEELNRLRSTEYTPEIRDKVWILRGLKHGTLDEHIEEILGHEPVEAPKESYRDAYKREEGLPANARLHLDAIYTDLGRPDLVGGKKNNSGAT